MTVGGQDVHAFWLLTETKSHACRGTSAWPVALPDRTAMCRSAGAW
jgi:hypothetical protein